MAHSPNNESSKPVPETATQSQGPPFVSAIGSIGAHARLWIVCAISVWADLASKRWAFTSLGPDETRSLIPGILDARRHLNAGALFGAFSGWVTVFVIASLLAVAFVLYVFRGSRPRQWFLHLGLSLILAGALGNLYDRAFSKADVVQLDPEQTGGVEQDIGVIQTGQVDEIIVASWPKGLKKRIYPRSAVIDQSRQGVVRDFFKFVPIAGFDYWPWVFNVADAQLVIGVCMLMLCVLFEKKTGEPGEDRPAIG